MVDLHLDPGSLVQFSLGVLSPGQSKQRGELEDGKGGGREEEGKEEENGGLEEEERGSREGEGRKGWRWKRGGWMGRGKRDDGIGERSREEGSEVGLGGWVPRAERLWSRRPWKFLTGR